MKTVLIVDDEADARQLIKEYLTDFPDFELIGEAIDGCDAVDKINTLKPEVIFLDIQMPGKNGFDVLTSIQYLPEIIFSTAYDEYAIEAFKVQALDYLLKPYGKKRFTEAIQRLTFNYEKIEQFAERLLLKRSKNQRKIIVHSGREKVFLSVDLIYYFEAFGDYTKVVTSKKDYLITNGISNVTEKLDENQFLRVHRSHTVNLDHVVSLKKEGRYHYLTFDNNHKIKVSETFLPKLKSLQF
jgi:two-component system LytT family response regulator